MIESLWITSREAVRQPASLAYASGTGMSLRTRVALLAISAAVAGGGLAACGSDDEPAGDSASESEQAEQTTTQPAGSY